MRTRLISVECIFSMTLLLGRVLRRQEDLGGAVQIEPGVESAWFQRVKHKYDKLLSC